MISLSLKPDHSRLQRALLAVVLTHLLAIMALAALPTAHAKIHHDSHTHEHECAVTLFLQGTVAASAAVAILLGATCWIVTGFIRLPLVWVENLFLSGSVLEHGPPAH